MLISFNVYSSTFLGAGQDVGRSCILVSIGGKNIMLDCGMHMGYEDEVLFIHFGVLVFVIDLLFKFKLSIFFI